MLCKLSLGNKQSADRVASVVSVGVAEVFTDGCNESCVTEPSKDATAGVGVGEAFFVFWVFEKHCHPKLLEGMNKAALA